MDKYECDQCGACCKGPLMVEAFDLDATREPQLLSADIGEWTRGMTEATLMAELEEYGKCIIIAAPGTPCRFLGDDERCSIYPTRPNVCVAMDAGDEQCQQAREQMGLPPLEPTEEAVKGESS